MMIEYNVDYPKMKMALGVITGVILGMLLIFSGGFLLMKYAVNQISMNTNQSGKPPDSALSDLSSQKSLVPSTTTATTPPVTPAPAITRPTATAPAAINPVSSSAVAKAVNFGLQIPDVSGDGLTRTITGEITNSGNLDAHNVKGKIDVFSSGKLVQINGQNYITRELGTIKAGQTVTTQIELTFGIFDGVSISQNGATVNLEIASDEATQTLKYNYKP